MRRYARSLVDDLQSIRLGSGMKANPYRLARRRMVERITDDILDGLAERAVATAHQLRLGRQLGFNLAIRVLEMCIVENAV